MHIKIHAEIQGNSHSFATATVGVESLTPIHSGTVAGMLPHQGYHFVWKIWKPGNVREFHTGQGKVRENAKNLLRSGKSQGIYVVREKILKFHFLKHNAAVVASLRMQDNAPFSI